MAGGVSRLPQVPRGVTRGPRVPRGSLQMTQDAKKPGWKSWDAWDALGVKFKDTASGCKEH